MSIYFFSKNSTQFAANAGVDIIINTNKIKIFFIIFLYNLILGKILPNTVNFLHFTILQISSRVRVYSPNPYTKVNSSFNEEIVFSKLSLSNTLNTFASGAIFLFKPARTFPGPISTKISTPSDTIF